MAGQPKRRAMFELLEQRATDYFEGDPTQTALDYVACWIEGGGTIVSLADDLGKSLGYNVGREWISLMLRREFGEDAASLRLSNARAHASHVMAEDALGISDDVVKSSEDASRNGLRVRARQWTAERWNRTQYGSQSVTNVSISLGGLHLTALQAVNREVTGGVQVASVPSPDTRTLPSQT